jgi:hypothetical protein
MSPTLKPSRRPPPRSLLAHGAAASVNHTSSFGVLEALVKPMPIRGSHRETWDENGLAVWTLRIGGQTIEGRWVIMDREFKLAE